MEDLRWLGQKKKKTHSVFSSDPVVSSSACIFVGERGGNLIMIDPDKNKFRRRKKYVGVMCGLNRWPSAWISYIFHFFIYFFYSF